MAYRKTEKVLAQLEAKRNSFIASAIDVIAKSGMEGLTTDAVAARAGVADGLLYSYFPDKTELLAAVVAHVLARDLAAIREAAIAEREPTQALAAAIAVFYGRMESPRVVRAMADQPAYLLPIRAELERLLKPATAGLAPKARALAAGQALGAIFGAYGVSDGSKNNAPATVLFVLRGIGLSDAAARKIVERRYPLLTA